MCCHFLTACHWQSLMDIALATLFVDNQDSYSSLHPCISSFAIGYAVDIVDLSHNCVHATNHVITTLAHPPFPILADACISAPRRNNHFYTLH